MAVSAQQETNASGDVRSGRSPDRPGSGERVGTAQYATKKRMYSFIEQIDAVQRLTPDKVLEIGVGNHFVSAYLSRYYDVVTVDVNPKLAPLCTATVQHLPFAKDSFDVTLCCQVLEHLPFPDFAPTLEEIRRVSRHLVLSLPDCAPKTIIQIPRYGRLQLDLRWPWWRPGEIQVSDHHWEINRAGYDVGRVTRAIESAGWIISDRFQLFENYKHHFFMLERAE